RWPSMDALLRVLTRGLERRGRWLFALGATVVLGLVAGGVFAVTAPAGPGCESLTQDVAAAWSDERSARVRNQFLETGLPFAAASWTSVGAQLDRYAETLARARVDACAARRHGALSDQLLDLRAACLGDRLADLETHVSLLESADATTVERSVVATGELPAIEPCDDGSALLERARLVRPPARARAEEVAGVTETVRELRLTLELGRTGELETRASAALERARALEYPPLIASAELTLALVHNHAARYEEAESRLRAALLAAEESRVDDVAAESCALLISVVGDKLARPTEALRWSPLCGAPIRRGELGPAYTTKLESNLGALRRSLEDYPRAREHYQRALTAAEQAHGARHRAYAHALNNLGAAEEDLGELERAVEDYERSLEIERALLGDEHPDLATPLNNLAVAERKLGRLDEAAAHLRRSVALLEAARLGGHDHYGTAVGNLGTLLRDQGDFEGARETYTRALEILAGALGPNHPAVGMMAMNRGELSLLTGAPARALEDFDRALEIVSTTLGPDTQLAAIVRVNVGLSQLELGADAAALASFTRVLELPTSTLPERDALRVYASAGLGRVALARGRKAEARALLERALADAQTHVEFDRAELGELRFALARALPESERAAAATLVAAAREELASRPERRAALERWLTGANAG
ncbi:MAG: tetratricopeptide repeat protein, partial [Myxococcales bacterium]|nr:tetratricopeptide repeat protein [Myxococcales bacterium]